MKGFIYRITRKSDGAVYIGKQSRFQSKNPDLLPDDIMGKKYWTSSKIIRNDWKQHPDAYDWEILAADITDDYVLAATEALYIAKAWEQEKNGKGPFVLNRYCNLRFHRSGSYKQIDRDLADAQIPVC